MFRNRSRLGCLSAALVVALAAAIAHGFPSVYPTGTTIYNPDNKFMARHETDNRDCYDCLLRGRELFMRFSEEGNREARKAFEQALEIDPNCAPEDFWWFPYSDAEAYPGE